MRMDRVTAQQFLTTHYRAVLATRRRDGRPQLSPVTVGVDAAIAAQMMLGLTEPQSSGIGGGALLLLYDGTHVVVFDGRETAPAAAMPERFLDAHGRPLAWRD